MEIDIYNKDVFELQSFHLLERDEEENMFRWTEGIFKITPKKEVKNICLKFACLGGDKKVVIFIENEVKNLKKEYSLQNNTLEFDFFIASLKFLYELSEILRLRIGQKEIIHDTKNANSSISRCSYKFCNYKDTCVYNYNTKSKSQCYQDHFVHRMVSADLLELIEYITNKFENQQQIIPNKEILKSINTLSFVINHMESELRAKCMYTEECEWESFHFIKN